MPIIVPPTPVALGLTLGQMQTSLQALGYGTDTAALGIQTEHINSAYRRLIGRRRWPFLAKTASIGPTVVGQGALSLAALTDLLHVEAVRIPEHELEYMAPEQILDKSNRATSTGTPLYWSRVIDTEVQLVPSPDAVYTVSLVYSSFPPPLVNSGDAAQIPMEYCDVLVLGAASLMAARERDVYVYEYFHGQFNERLREMETNLSLRQRQTSSRVVHSNFWDSVGR